MTDPSVTHHHHHHHDGERHPPAPLGLSLLRLSLTDRLAIALMASAVIWAAVFWAIR